MPDQEPEMYELPDLKDAEYWERFHAAGLNEPDPAQHTNGTKQFAWIDLTHPEYAVPPQPPTIKGILYAGRRHVISGPPESTKTLIAYMLLLEALRAGEGVAILDFEMGPHAAATLLRELGATDDELQQIQYTEPEGPPGDHDIARLTGLVCGYVLIDAAAGAYDVTGLDDNARKDAEQFAAKWIRPLWQSGVATIVIDHVTKDTTTRGKFVIGSERKIGQADVHLSLESLKPLTRGGTGMVKINVMRDRPGHLPRPTVYTVELDSDDTHHITWELRTPEPVEHTPAGSFQPTIYMDKVSRHMQTYPELSFSKNELCKEVGGRAELVRLAVDELHRLEHVAVAEKRGGHPTFTLLRPFVPSSSQFVPDEGDPQFVPSSQSLTGTKTRDEPNPDEPIHHLVPDELDVYDPAIERLLDDDIPF